MLYIYLPLPLDSLVPLYHLIHVFMGKFDFERLWGKLFTVCFLLMYEVTKLYKKKQKLVITIPTLMPTSQTTTNMQGKDFYLLHI